LAKVEGKFYAWLNMSRYHLNQRKLKPWIQKRRNNKIIKKIIE
jgi:hypothetical protein